MRQMNVPLREDWSQQGKQRRSHRGGGKQSSSLKKGTREVLGNVNQILEESINLLPSKHLEDNTMTNIKKKKKKRYVKKIILNWHHLQ